MTRSDMNFRERVYEVVQAIPSGRAMTYGDVATYAGQPLGARIVGQIAHFGPPDLPWQRVVNRFGGLASGYYGGRQGHRADLEKEGIEVGDDFTIANFEEVRWRPNM